MYVRGTRYHTYPDSEAKDFAKMRERETPRSCSLAEMRYGCRKGGAAEESPVIWTLVTVVMV